MLRLGEFKYITRAREIMGRRKYGATSYMTDDRYQAYEAKMEAIDGWNYMLFFVRKYRKGRYLAWPIAALFYLTWRLCVVLLKVEERWRR